MDGEAMAGAQVPFLSSDERSPPPVAQTPLLEVSRELLETRQNAEDECVRDLRTAMRVEAGLADRDKGSRFRASSEPPKETREADLPCPEAGRFRDVAQPGGFRRHHVRQTSDCPEENAHVQTSLVQMLLPSLRESALMDFEDESEACALEQRVGGDASNYAVAFVIAKNFFGSAFMITPKGFEEAGVLGGPVCLLSVFVLEVRCMLNLVKCREVVGAGKRYEDLGECLAPWFPTLITVMIMLCQFGFCCIWLVSNAENLSMVLPQLDYASRLWIQLPVLIPLVWIRHLRLFAVTNIIGIFFTAAMAVFFFVFMGTHLASSGPQPVRVVNTDNSDLLLWLGSCAYAYEGINIVLPTYESARDKEAMPKMLVSITSFNTLMYIAFGVLTYTAFGAETASLATLNLPKGSAEGRAIPLISVLIGLVSFPLQAFVIFQMYEPKLTWSGAYLVRKWQKNMCRTALLVFVFTVTWLGGNQLQNFLALVGGFCCASLALIFPSMLHIGICKPKGSGLFLDRFIFVCGWGILLLSTVQAIASWK